MSRSWYARIVADPGDFSPVIADAYEYFDREYLAAVQEIDLQRLRGQRVEEIAKQLPGIVGYRCNQMFELAAICDYLEIRETAVRGARRRHYIEHYNRALTPTTVEKYVDADEEVLMVATLINLVKFMQHKFEALSKQHEYLHFQLSNISKLIAAGVNDAIF